MSRKLWILGAVLVATGVVVAVAGGLLEPLGKSAEPQAPGAAPADTPTPSSAPAIAEIATAEGRALAESDGFGAGAYGASGSIDPLDFEIEGRVVDAKQQPIDGAFVRLAVATAPIPSPSALEIFRAQGLIAEEQRRKTGRDGRFRFRAPFVDGGGLLLSATAKGYAPASRHDLAAEAGARVNAGDFMLAQGGTIVGRVLDPSGAPAVGAHAGVVPTPSAGPAEKFLNLIEPEPFGDADAQGQFQIANLPDGRYSVIAWAPGLARGASPPVMLSHESTATPTVELRLAPGESIRGVVVSTDDQALPEARIRAKLKPVESDDGSVSYELPISTTSDADGAFLLDGLVAGRQYDVTASLKGFRDTATNARTGATGLRLVLRPDLKVRGVVVDAETKQPIPSAHVVVYRGKPGDLQPVDALLTRSGAVSDSRGRFVAGDSGKAGAARVLAWARGYAPGLSEPVNLVEKGDPPETTIALERGGVVSGRIVAGADRTPVAGASVALISTGRGRPPLPMVLDRVTSASDGRFEFLGLGAGTYVLEARQPSFGTGRSDPTTLAQGDRRDGFDVALPAASTIRGVVLTGGATVNTRVSALRDDGLYLAAYPDSENRFSFAKLGPGKYSLRAEKLLTLDDALFSELRPAPRRAVGPGWVPVTLPEGRVVDVTLDLLGAETGRVTGMVMQDGRGLSGATLVLARETEKLPQASEGNPVFGPHRTTTADVEGVFEFPAAAPGIYRLYAIPRGRSSTPKNAVAADTVQVLANSVARRDLIGRSGALRGRVVRPNGSPMSGATVAAVVNGSRGGSAVLPGGTSFRSKTGGNGAFDFGRLPGGAYDVIVEAGGFARKTVAADVDSGYAEPLSITLDAPAGQPGKKLTR